MAVPLRVAVVDDDRLVRAIISDGLQALGLSVTAFSSAEEALQVLWEQPVDGVVTDLYLPRMSGIDFLRALRRRDWAKGLTCVAISGADWPKQDLDRLSTMPSMIIRKPFDIREFATNLKWLLETRLEGAKGSGETAADERSGAPDEPALWSTAQLVERRGSGRMDAGFRVKLTTPEEVLFEYTENISHEGMFIRTSRLLPLDSSVEIDLELPYRSTPLHLRGSVVRAVSSDSPDALAHPPGFAVALSDIAESMKDEFSAFLAGYRAGAAMQARQSMERRMLLVGRHPDLRPSAISLLERLSFRSYWATDLAQAKATALRIHPELVVLDDALLDASTERWLAELACISAPPEIILYGSSEQRSREVSIARTGSPEELSASVARTLGVGLRGHRRVPLQADAWMQRADGRVRARLTDLSLSGLGCLVDAPCAAGEVLDVEFQLPGSAQATKIRAKACVAWTTGEKDRCFRIGARFLELRSPEASEAILSFVHRARPAYPTA